MSGRQVQRAHRRRSRVTTVGFVLLLVTGLVAAALSAAAAARADDTCTATWTGGSGTWSDASRWSPAQVPGADDVVCVGHTAGTASPVVRVRRSVVVASTSLDGASLVIAPDVTFQATQFAATRAAVSGGGTLIGVGGTLALTDTRVDHLIVVALGRLTLARRVTLTGGTAMTTGRDGNGDLRPGLTVVDGDGNPQNHLDFGRFPLYLTGSVFLGVRVGLTDTLVFAQNGEVAFAALDNLDDDGTLHTLGGAARTLQLATGASGTVRLPRSVTRVGRGVSVFADDVTTPRGTDALADLRSIDGAVSLTRPLLLGGPLTIGGRYATSTTLYAPVVTVQHSGSFTGPRMDGELRSAGVAVLAGSHLGRLTLVAGSTTYTDLTSPVVVAGRAVLAGALTVQLPGGRLPAVGTRLVLLTATDGVTGTFGAVGSDQPERAGIAVGYRPTWVTGALTVPAG